MSITLEEAKKTVWPSIQERAQVKVKAVLEDNTTGKDTNICRYRVDLNPINISPKNCCFIGIGIKPEYYKDTMEGSGIYNCNVYKAYCHSFNITFKTSEDNQKFTKWLSGIQGIHDNNYVDKWDDLLKTFDPTI